MADEKLLGLVADIVAAHVSNNSVTIDDLPQLIQSVFSSLSELGSDPVIIEKKLVPAVSVRSSVKPESIKCLDCGTRMKMLKRHLMTDHKITPEQYRVRWGLPATYPLVAPDYAAKRAQLARKIGLGRKPAAPPPAPAVKTKAPRKTAKRAKPTASAPQNEAALEII